MPDFRASFWSVERTVIVNVAVWSVAQGSVGKGRGTHASRGSQGGKEGVYGRGG